MKERLTGAIILVALIVLLVPELLTGPIGRKPAPAASSVVTSLAASHAEPALRSYTLTLDAAQPAHRAAMPPAQAPAQPAAGSLASPTRAPAGNPAAGAAESPAQIIAPQQAASPRDADAHSQDARRAQQGTPAGSGDLQVAKSPAHPLVREAGSSASSGGWVVQLGSFASRQNADRLARSLERRGFRMSVSPGRAGSRVLWRVRAGPAHDRPGAQRLAARLQALGHRGELLPIK